MIRRLLSLSRYSMLSGIGLLLGFLREVVVSAEYGLSPELDVYVAMMGFYLFFGVQVGNALEMVFVSKSGRISAPMAVTARLSQVLSVLLPGNVIMLSLLYVTAEYLIAWIFPGFDGKQRGFALILIANLLVAVVFANMAGPLRAGLNVLRVFTPGLLSGSVISVVSILAVVFFSSELGIKALLYGFIAGNGLVFALMASAFFKRADFSGRQLSIQQRKEPYGFWKPFVIVLAGEVFFQAFTMTERGFASTFESGTIAAFSYAWTLVTTPVSLVVMPLSTVVYPRLAETFQKDPARGSELVTRYGVLLFLLALLVVTVFSWCSEWVVKLVFMRGRFTSSDAEKTAELLSVLIFALPFLSVSRLTRYSLYSLSNYAASSFALLTAWIVLFFGAYVSIPDYGILGLAYSSTSAVAAETLVMCFVFRWMIKREQY
jgi:putative peptidoglycan lipid II flippase